MGQCRVASEFEDAWLTVNCLTEAVMQRSRSTSFSPVIFVGRQHVVVRGWDRQGPEEEGRGPKGRIRPHIYLERRSVSILKKPCIFFTDEIQGGVIETNVNK